MERQVRLRNMLSWGSGDIVANGQGTILGLWALFFYVQVAGLSPVQAGSIFAIGKIWDALNDPIIGYWSDNIRTRWGRRRVFLLFGSPLMLLYGLMWISGHDYIYYLVTYLSFNTAMSVLGTPWITLPSEMTNDVAVKTKMGTVRMLFSQATAFLATLIPGLFLNYFDSQETAFMYMGITMGIVFVIPWLLVFIGTWEIPQEELPEPTKLSVIDTIKQIYIEMFSTFKLRTFRLHLLMYVGGFSALDIIGSLLVFYGIYLMDVTATQAGTAMSIMSFAQFASVVFFTWIAMKTSNAFAFLIALALVVISLVSFTFVSTIELGSMYTFISIIIVLGVGRAGINLIPWVNYNFISDIDEILTSRKRAGIYGAVMNLSRKVTAALALLLVSSLLQFVGFESGSDIQSSEAINGLYWIFLATPVAFISIAVYATIKFKLDAKACNTVSSELQRLRSGGKLEDAESDVKELVEELTGWEHQYTWGNTHLKCKKKLSNAYQ